MHIFLKYFYIFLYISKVFIYFVYVYIFLETQTHLHTQLTHGRRILQALAKQCVVFNCSPEMELHHGGEILQRCRACGHQPPAWKMLGKCVRPLKAWHFPVHGVALTSSTASTLRPALDWSCVLHRFASGD